MWIVLTVVLCLASELVAGEKEKTGDTTYQGYTVFRVTPTTQKQVLFLRSLERNHDEGISFWSHATGDIGSSVDIMVSPEKKSHLANLLESEGFSVQAIIPNIKDAISEERKVNLDVLMERSSKSFFASYQRIDKIYNFLDDLVREHSNIASTQSIGKTSEGRQLKVIKISSGGKADKPVFWLDGGIHAREWISTATVTYIVSQLVEGYSSNADIKKLVDDYDWYIQPVVNPDGYEFTHTVDRMWRGTRSVNPASPWCPGADPNRNYGYKWKSGGSSNNPCDETYAGRSAFSEPETKAQSDFVYAMKDRVKAFVTVHAYSQLWLFPWGWTSALPKDYTQMKAAADVAVAALRKVHGTKYQTGTSTNVLYVASGGSDDWAYGAAGIKYSYTVELRDTGRYGFLLPSTQIIPTGEETFEAIKALANYILKNP